MTFSKVFVVLCGVLVLNVPTINAYKHRKGGTTSKSAPATQAPQPTQGPNQDAAKLSYGNNAAPPPYGQSTGNNQPPSYQPYGGGHPPPYSQNPPQGQQPVIINHVQQPQSSGGGLGTAGGLAVGKLQHFKYIFSSESNGFTF